MSSLYASDTYSWNNAGANLDVWSCPSFTIVSSWLYGAGADARGYFGDGLRVWASTGSISDSESSWNPRAGVSIFGCSDRAASVEIGTSHFDGNGFPFNIETADLPATLASGTMVSCSSGGAGVSLSDAGGNRCTDKNGVTKPCQSFTAGDLTPTPR